MDQGDENPATLSPELAQQALGLWIEGGSLADACRAVGIPTQTLYEMAMLDRDGFRADFIRARTIKGLIMEDQICEIADDGSGDWIQTPSGRWVVNEERIRRDELRCKTLSRLSLKYLPKRFGGKADDGFTGKIIIVVRDD